MERLRNAYHQFIGSEGFVAPGVLRTVEAGNGSILLETTKLNRSDYRTYIFLHPDRIVHTRRIDEVEGCLDEIEKATQGGLYAAGFLSYEAGQAFEKKIRTPLDSPTPLIWFGLYSNPVILNHREQKLEGGAQIASQIHASLEGSNGDKFESHLQQISRSISEEEYRRAFEKIKELLAEGDTYQVNFTFQLGLEHSGSVAATYRRLSFGQRVGYAAFVNTGAASILSFSPELFFRLSRETITLKPMKGTAPRGRTLEEDEVVWQELTRSEKDRAENRMIVDLLRSDVGRIARTGTISVKRFFDIERFETVFQATSTITAAIDRKTSTKDIMKSLHPSGSVTGAPKIRTMQIIYDLEKSLRGIYTGCIGFLTPRRRAVFSVAIRTLVLENDKQKASYGIGSGVTNESKVDLEYDECLLKARFLIEPAEDFQLIETMRWERGKGLFLLSYHFKRLSASARYFDFRFDRSRTEMVLAEFSKKLTWILKKEPICIVRLTLDRRGRVDVQHRLMEEGGRVPTVRLSTKRTNSSDRFLFHKTTRRTLYDEELRVASKEGHFDVLFLNEREELTEGARTNIFVRKNGMFMTPLLTCGVLPGVYRSYLLKSRRQEVKEGRLFYSDLREADELYLCNAVRGLVKLRLQDGEQPLQDSHALHNELAESLTH